MNFREWQQLSPAEATRECRRRIETALSPRQRSAAIAYEPGSKILEASFTVSEKKRPLASVPFFVKDLFDIAGLPTKAGSTFLPEVRPLPTTTSAIVQAFRAAGAVFVGKTHLHEFAYGITGENAHYGDCDHPRFPGRTSGGSSSGSAVVVASGIAPLALGSDTGGSIRVPAAFCGLYGYRGTPKDALIEDAFPLAPTCDTAGWFTESAGDLAASIAAVVGESSSDHEPRGVYLEMPGLDLEVSDACAFAANKFASRADSMTEGSLLQSFARAGDVYNRIVSAEAWKTHQSWSERFRERYDPAVWQRIQRGAALSDTDYSAALADRERMREVWMSYFEAYDFLIMPATPFEAPRKSECTLANRNRILALTAPASLGGFPVVTIPVTLLSGLTTGLQIIAADPRSPVFPWALKLARSI